MTSKQSPDSLHHQISGVILSVTRIFVRAILAVVA
jgi:hypothetical protein